MALGYEIPGRDVVALLAGDFRPEMIEALRRIKTRFKTGCITNNMSADAAGATATARFGSIISRSASPWRVPAIVGAVMR